MIFDIRQDVIDIPEYSNLYSWLIFYKRKSIIELIDEYQGAGK